ncbi:MAG TPA: sugar ABC transporter ATP-binding protein [Anaerolineales bacterium]|nr:sugar ABC transporter ATP-binding protein [Anaerolineales bacterium]
MADANHELIVMKSIHKSFPGVKALEDVDFSLRKGEVHALVGENGAGKSTLIKILTGVEKPNKGSITLDGKEVSIKSPQHAQELGISTVYQEVNLCPNLTIAENILIGREPMKLGSIDWKAMNAKARQILAGLDIDMDVTRTLGSCSVAIQQMAAIARALEISSARILVLDEPTSSLDIHETEQLFGVMRKLRDEGMAIIFITHFLDQVYEIADRITVLRNGKLVGSYETKAITRLELITKMIGRTLTEFDEMSKLKLESRRHIKSDVLLEAKGAGRAGSIRPFDLDLHQGEVVGLAGLLGSGRTEIAQLLFGVVRPDSGSISMDGQPIRNYSPIGSISRGVALCPEDRKAEGILGDLTVRENIILAMQANLGWFKHLSSQEQYAIADKYIKLLNIATPSPDQPVKNLSGGNQQKVILARWLATNPRLLILDEPTRGIDVGTKAEIQRLVLSLAEEGKSCVFISSELEEVLRTGHRIVVLREREKVTEFGGEADERKVMQAIAGSAS